MRKIWLIFLTAIILSCLISFAFAHPPYPIIFVHGIGDSSVAWKTTGPKVSTYYEKYYKTETHPYFNSGSGIGKNRDDKNFSDNLKNTCIYVTFKDYYDSPANQAQELKKVIEDTIDEVWQNFLNYFNSKDDIKINLVAHSMGGLVCRKYILDHPTDHKVNIFLSIDTLNLGTPALYYRWIPYTLDIGGIAGALVFSSPLLLSSTAIGIGVDMLFHSYGIRLLSPATDSMHPDSNFLKELNSLALPEDIKYRAIISDSSAPLQQGSNFMFGFRKGGDGAVPIESQSLKNTGIPNFNKLDYEEYVMDSPHFEAFSKVANKIIEILNLE